MDTNSAEGGPVERLSANLSRRKFLAGCCQGTAAVLLPSGLCSLTLPYLHTADFQIAPAPHGEFHVHPHYRSQRPLDAILLKTQPGLDNFITEKYAAQITAILARWRASLLESPAEVQSVAKVLAARFSGSSFRPVGSRLVRAGPLLEVRQNKFSRETVLRGDAFLEELKSSLSSFSKLETAELQVVTIKAADMDGAGINAGSGLVSATAAPGSLQTRVRYELVGSGRDCYREQRVGYWELEWEPSPQGEFLLRRWQTLDETRSRSARPVFVDITAPTFGANASYSSQLLPGVDYWRTVLDGACGIDIYGHNGVSVGDIDGDGFDDVYVCQPAGLPNRLYRNRGDGTFDDITEASGLGILENTACALLADIDNDGRQDLIVVRTNGPLLFLNEGNGKFRRQPDAFQFATPPQGTFTGAAVADYDRDGWLDIYFCLYAYYQGTDQYRYPSPYYDADNGPPNFMMRNHRDGTFRDVTSASGLNQGNTRYSFCCGWNDYNHDGWPDLYVVNDFGRKNLYRNNGDGTFTDVASQAGVEDVGAGMSVCWFDCDNDGVEDLYVADMWTAAGVRVSMQEIFQQNAPAEARALYRKHAMGNSLFRNRGDGTFADAGSSAGVEMGRWAWSSDAWDFDHDGFADLYITNGMVSGPGRDDLNSFFWRHVVANSPLDSKPSHDYEQGWNAINELIRADGTWSGFERNVFYANNRDGTFSDVSGAVGLDFPEDGRSFALADFDHDGRLEMLLKNRNSPQLRLMKNVIENLSPSISFRLRGRQGNRDAIGAVVTVASDRGRQTRSLQAGSGFLSQHSKDVFFGLGETKGPVRATIRWPSGQVQELFGLPLNHRIWVEEGSPPSRTDPFHTVTSLPTQVDLHPAPESESLPSKVETWLLAPVAAPDFSLPDLTGRTRTLAALRGQPLLLYFCSSRSEASLEDLTALNRAYATWTAQGLQLVTVIVDDTADIERTRALVSERRFSLPILPASDDVAGVYNILYRYLFDRHRDLGLPTSFLIDEKGDIVKVYQGPMNLEHVEHDFRHIPQNHSDRLARALPFTGVTDASGFSHNYLSYGSVYFQRGYFDQAETAFRRALGDDPSSAEALYGLGSVYLNQKKTREARESFEQVTRLRSSYPDTLPNAWNNLGLLAAQEGRTAEAVQFFQKALQLSPDHVVALDNLGNAYRQLKQWDEAREVLQRAVEVSPQDAEANYSLGMVFAQLDDTERAYNYLQRALKYRPAYPEALNNLGVLYLRTQRRDQAIASFDECIRVAPAFDQSYLNLARVYAIEAKPEKARAILVELLKQHPGHAQAEKMLEELGR